MTPSPTHPLLTIAVPTFNRYKYFVELLPELVAMVEQNGAGQVKILIVD